LNSDGSLDTTFDPGTGFNQHYYGIKDVVLQSDGKIVVGGDFTTYNGTSQNYITRLNTDGSLDTSFNSGTGANGYVYATAIDSNGKILIGGTFSSYNGTSRNSVARLNSDGTLDTTFDPGSGVGGGSQKVGDIAIQSSGRILIAGSFNSYNGHTQPSLVGINTDGSFDTTFDPCIGWVSGTIYTYEIFSASLKSDDSIILGGNDFENYNGEVLTDSIAHISADGVTNDDNFFPIVTVNISAPTSVTSTSATGNGVVVNTAGENVTRTIQWDPNQYGFYNYSCSAGSGSTGSYSCAITGLSDGVTYGLRARVNNSYDTVHSDAISFVAQTPTATAPTISSTAPTSSSVTSTSATITANITDTGGEDPDRLIQYGIRHFKRNVHRYLRCGHRWDRGLFLQSYRPNSWNDLLRPSGSD